MPNKIVNYFDPVKIHAQVQTAIELIFRLSVTKVKKETKEADLATKHAIAVQINQIDSNIIAQAIQDMLISDRNDFHRAAISEGIRLHELELISDQFIANLLTILTPDQLRNGAIGGCLYEYSFENGINIREDINAILADETKQRIINQRRATLGTAHGAGFSPEEISRLRQGQIYLIIDNSGKFKRWGPSGDIGFQDITRRNIGRKPDENQVFVDLHRRTFQIEHGPAITNPEIKQNIGNIALLLADQHFPSEYK